MTIQEILFSELSGSLGVLIASRIYPQPPKGMPQGAQLPAITYQIISGTRVYTPTGRSGSISSRFQFNCFGRSEKESQLIAQTLIDAFDLLPLKNFVYGPRDLSDPYTQAIYPSVDVVVWHHEDIPVIGHGGGPNPV